MRNLTRFALFASLLVAVPAFAEMKIAVLNYQMALLESDAAKKYAVDAEKKFEVADIQTRESEICVAGQVLQGLKKPPECPAFGKQCTPQNPLGATMVSSEGACAAYYRYGRTE